MADGIAPQTLLFNGRILSGIVGMAPASAVCVDRGIVQSLKSRSKDGFSKARPTQAIDLEGRTVIPGLVDAHAHLDREGLKEQLPNLAKCRSIEDVLDVIRETVRELRPGEWVVLGPLGTPPFYDEPHLSLRESRYPHRVELDRVSSDNPVWIRAPWGLLSNKPPFVHILNSLALKYCDITTATLTPSSTVDIERDSDGRLSGRLIESSVWPVAEHTLLRHAPGFDTAMRRRSIALSHQLASRKGLTAIYEGHGCAPELLDAHISNASVSSPLVRSYLPLSLPPWSSITGLKAQLRDYGDLVRGVSFERNLLRTGGIFVNYGGNAETAAIQQSAYPYTGWAGFVDQSNSPDEYKEICRVAAQLGLRVNTIAMDNLPSILKIWQEIDNEFPISGLRWVLAHVRRFDSIHYKALRELDVVITTLPGSHLYRFGGNALHDPGENVGTLVAHRDFKDAGIHFALATDNKPYDPFFPLWSSMTRIDSRSGRIIDEDQRLSFEEAVSAMCNGGAYIAHEEAVRGDLRPGKVADLVVIDGPISADNNSYTPPRVEMTMLEGRIVYASNEIRERIHFV